MWYQIILFTTVCVFTYVLKKLHATGPNKFKFYFNFCIFYFLTSVLAAVIWPYFLLSPKNVRNAKIAVRLLKHVTKLYDLEWHLRDGEILAEDRGAVIISNHQSSLDILGMFNIWDVVDKLAAIAKKELFYIWPFGLSAYLAGVVFIDRSNAKGAYKQLKMTSEVMVKNKCDLETLADDPSEQYAEREEFEKQYYSLVATARQLISATRSRQAGDSSSEVGSCASHTHTHNSIRLPKIDLPKFSGSYHDWLEFRDTFISIIHSNNNISKINKLHYLRASLKDSASLVVDNLDFSAENYDAAWRLLCDRYDNKRLLVNNHVQALFNVNPISKESSKSLRLIIDTTNKNLRALSTLGQPVQHWDTLIIYIMASKLDQVTNREWEEHRNSLTEPPTLNIFINFLSNRSDLLETLEESKSIKTRGEGHSDNNKSNKSFLATTDKPKYKPLLCPMCKQDHHVFTCETFKSLPVEVRNKRVHGFNVCLNCLRPGHDANKCKLGNCKYCNKKHNTLLHVHTDSELSNTQNVVLSANHSASSRIILLSTALVRVTDTKGSCHTARVLLDNGSTANFVSSDLVLTAVEDPSTGGVC
ncbi:uncharacterized protein LOC118262431 isoform X3 [Spodoptera frugiperda]|uniref:Uncharacterized protein LOC118262431 isoform X3 n=1 Tax=Spodoptera frugiperda TaxID=7108 RepID=A0A9R0DU42_SPOFR|nr:uncharacterized protein LOC118262431 isoform X3 [Spodoptera frugiperda]